MSEDQDEASKTEEPTQKRIEEAVKKGQVVFSREVSSFFILLGLTFIIVMAPFTIRGVNRLILPFLEHPETMELDFAAWRLLMGDLMLGLLGVMTLPILIAVAAALASSIIQNRFIWSAEPILPKLEKISPLKGFERQFSRRSMVEFGKSVLKIIIVGAIVTIAIWPYKEELRLLPDFEMHELMLIISRLALRIMVAACCVMFLIAIIDYMYQKYEYLQKLRMTKQELKDEYKQQEGDPQVKQKLRQIRMERARRRMMAAVPDSDVVVTNPTHFAVALKYDSAKMSAPTVVAKGQDKVAARIRELAEENKVPVVRNPPLARLLFDNVDLDEEVPHAYYRMVAEVISYVYKLKGVKLQK